MTAKYVFYTHGTPFVKLSRRQIIVNVWHGVLYKNLGMLLGGKGQLANYTVGTSSLTKEMFSKAFGVDQNTITESGIPRNDILIEAQGK